MLLQISNKSTKLNPNVTAIDDEHLLHSRHELLARSATNTSKATITLLETA